MNNKNKISISKRYARSLLKLAEEQNSILKVKSELNNIKEILNSSSELYSALINPIVNKNDKKEIIERIFERDTSFEVRNFLKLLIEKGRVNFVHSIIEEFYTLFDISENIAHIQITSALELNDEQKHTLEEKLALKLQKKIEVEYLKDSSIIAGLICKIGDNVIDTSLSYKLNQFKKELIKN